MDDELSLAYARGIVELDERGIPSLVLLDPNSRVFSDSVSESSGKDVVCRVHSDSQHFSSRNSQ